MMIIEHKRGSIRAVTKRDRTLLFTSCVMTESGMAYFRSVNLDEVVSAASKLSPGVADRIAELIVEARGWLLDCFPDDEHEIADCSDSEIVIAVNRYYDGGWDAFLLANS